MSDEVKKIESTIELKRNARLIGVLMLVQMIFGILLNFVFLKPILSLNAESVTSNLSYLIGFSTILALMLSSINIVFGLLLPKAVITLLKNNVIFIIVLGSAGFMLSALEYVKMTEYVFYAEGLFQQSHGAISSTEKLLRKTFAAGRNEAHYLSIIFSSLSILLFYVVSLRSKLLPKSLSLFAIFSCSLQLIAVGHTLFALAIPNVLQLPLLITQIVLPFYLIVKGFNISQVKAS